VSCGGYKCEETREQNEDYITIKGSLGQITTNKEIID
jgi:hypothetical protein